MRVAVELFRSLEGRLSGELRVAEGRAEGRSEPFDGLLELLRILETLDLGPTPSEPQPHGDEHDEH